jgi:steroid 5-alpha reductase family enzyme
MAGAPAYSMMIDPKPHSRAPPPPTPGFKMTTGDVGILKSTILPSFGLYSGLSVAAYAVAQSTDRLEIKDWLWPSAQVLNAWVTAIGRPMYETGITFSDAWTGLTWSEKLLLGGVTIWGTRLFARIVSRSLARRGDDPRYDARKKEPGFWKTALFKIFLPEAAFLSFISLPITVPYSMGDTTLSVSTNALSTFRAFAVGLFSSGFALEVMADTQLELHRKEREDLCRHGVWSIVRHPK